MAPSYFQRQEKKSDNPWFKASPGALQAGHTHACAPCTHKDTTSKYRHTPWWEDVKNGTQHLKEPRDYRLDCENKPVQPALVLKIYTHQSLSSHQCLSLHAKQRFCIFTCSIAILLTLSSGEEANTVRMRSWQQQYYNNMLWVEEKGKIRPFPKEIKTWCWCYHTTGWELNHTTYFI